MVQTNNEQQAQKVRPDPTTVRRTLSKRLAGSHAWTTASLLYGNGVRHAMTHNGTRKVLAEGSDGAREYWIVDVRKTKGL